MIGKPDRNVKKTAVPKALKDRHSCLNKMSTAVHLVHHIEVSPLQPWVIELEKRVQVTVWLLSGLNGPNHGVKISTDDFIVPYRQGECRRLGKLVDIAIVKPKTFKLPRLRGRFLEIGNPPGSD